MAASKSGSDLKPSSAALNDDKSSKEPIFCQQASDSVIDLVTDQLNALFVENETCKLTEEPDIQVRSLRGRFSNGVYVRYLTNLCEMLNVNLSIKFHALELFDLFMAKHFSEATRVARRCFGEEWVSRWPTTLDRIEDQMILRMISCVQIAAKIRLNEDSVHLSSLMYVLRRCKQNFDKSSVLASEIRVLKTVDFFINQKTPLDYVEILIEALGRNEPNLHTENLYRVAVDVVDIFYFVKAELYEKLRERLKRTAASAAGTQETAARGSRDRSGFLTPKKDSRTPPPAAGPENDRRTSAVRKEFGIFKTPQTMPKAKGKHCGARGNFNYRGKDSGDRNSQFITKDSLFQAQSRIAKARFVANRAEIKAGAGGETRRVNLESLFTPAMQSSTTHDRVKSKKKGRNRASESQQVSRESLFTPITSCKGDYKADDCETLFSPAASSKTKGENRDDDDDEELSSPSTSAIERNSVDYRSCVEDAEAREKLWKMMENDKMFLAAAVISSAAYILHPTEFVRVVNAVVDIVQLSFDNVVDFTVVLLESVLLD